jgi:hypothetical protein
MRQGIYLAVVGALVATAPSRAGEGLVALQTADSACADESANTYVDCANGTVTDTRSGLIWLQDASCFEAAVVFRDAIEFVEGLSDGYCGLQDGSSPGEWRLPSVAEWTLMTLDAVVLNCIGAFAPAITNDAGTHCWAQQVGENSFLDIKSEQYWAAYNTPASVHGVHLGLGQLFETSGMDVKTTDLAYVWPVRGGQ